MSINNEAPINSSFLHEILFKIINWSSWDV